LADAYSRRRDYKNAEGELKIGLRLNPYYVDAYHALGVLYRITKRDDEALSLFQKAVELNPNLWQGQRNIALIYMERKEYEKALEHIKKGLSINPSNERMKRDLEVILREIRGDRGI
jgi:tetratricopeptide (TPR) repeat protein